MTGVLPVSKSLYYKLAATANQRVASTMQERSRDKSVKPSSKES
jgi:hypothetical protein